MTNQQLIDRLIKLSGDIKECHASKITLQEHGRRYIHNTKVWAKIETIHRIIRNRGKNLLYWFGEFYLSDDFAEIAGPKTDRPVYEPESNERRVRSFVRAEWKIGLNQWYLNTQRRWNR